MIVRSHSGNEGAIVQCVHLIPDWHGDPVWGVKTSGRLRVKDWVEENYAWCQQRGFDILVCASCLRPIRDNDGEDEVLRVAGKPQDIPLKVSA